MITEKVEVEIAVFFNTHPASKKYDSPENRATIAARLSVWGFTPCEVGVMRALAELVDEGAIERVDGGSEASDRQAAEASGTKAHQTPSGQCHRQPLRISNASRGCQKRKLRALFYSEMNRSGLVTKKRVQPGIFAFLPSRRRLRTLLLKPDLGEWKNLDAKSYHSIPARQTTHLYMTNKLFKKAVDKLISQGAI